MSSKADMKKRFRIVGQAEDGAPQEPYQPPLSLEALQRMSASAIRDAYERAPLPDSVKALDGPLDGALVTLAGPLSEGAARRLTRRISGSARFPWQGKTFQSWAEDRGSGINRLRLLGERLWCHFETRIDRSSIDGKAAVILDYDHADNPWPVRQVRDELREVAPGLWLGPATFRGVVLLYFAVTSLTR